MRKTQQTSNVSRENGDVWILHGKAVRSPDYRTTDASWHGLPVGLRACAALLIMTLTAFRLPAADEAKPLDRNLLITCVLSNSIETPFTTCVVAATTAQEFRCGRVVIPKGAEVRGVATPGDRIILGGDDWTLRWQDSSTSPLKTLKVKGTAMTNLKPRENSPVKTLVGIGGYAVEPGPIDDLLDTLGLVKSSGGPLLVRAPAGTVFGIQLSTPIAKEDIIEAKEK